MPELTENERREQERQEALERLTVDEQIAYDKFCRSGRPGVEPAYNQRLYELFLRGVSCEAICLLNPGLTLGHVLKARVDGRWDKKRDAYTAELLTESNAVLRQTAAEAVQFLSLVLAVAHKEHGERLKKYLASGDPKDLGDFRIQNFGGYKTIIDTLARLVGADQKKSIDHKHTFVPGVPGSVGSGAAPEPEQPSGLLGGPVGRLSPRQADAMRAAFEKTRGE